MSVLPFCSTFDEAVEKLTSDGSASPEVNSKVLAIRHCNTSNGWGNADSEVLPVRPRNASDWWRRAALKWHESLADAETDFSTSCVKRHRNANPEEDYSGTPQRSSKKMALLHEPSQSPAGQPSPCSFNLNKVDVMCSICCGSFLESKAVRFNCGHGWYCTDCVRRYAEERLSMGDTHILCPECGKPISESHLRKLLPKDVLDRLLARSLEVAVSSAADLWYCPTPNCVMCVAVEKGRNARYRCPLCKQESCLRCRAQPYHTGVRCKTYAKKMNDKHAEDSLKEWIIETGARQCPTCQMVVTKENLGKQKTQYAECHKMMCRNCNTRFCFNCLALLTMTHTCGCSADGHGFINPHTGRRITHLRGKKM